MWKATCVHVRVCCVYVCVCVGGGGRALREYAKLALYPCVKVRPRGEIRRGEIPRGEISMRRDSTGRK